MKTISKIIFFMIEYNKVFKFSKKTKKYLTLKIYQENSI